MRIFWKFIPVALLASCTAVQDLQTGRLAVGDEYMVSSAVTGEQCRVRKLGDDRTRLRVESFDIRCDGWDVAAGTLKRFVFAAGAPLEPLLERGDLIPWQTEKLNCEATQTAQLGDGSDILVRNCVSREGWPLQAWAARTQTAGLDGALVGFGYPHIAAIVEDILGGEGAQLRRSGTRSPLVALAQTAHNGSLPQLTEIMDFHLLLDIAARYNQAGQFDEAVAAIEQALIRQKTVQGADTAHLATIYAELGLNLASAGRTTAAEASFKEARKRAEKIEWSDAYTLYLSYLAIHRRLEGRLDEATKITQEVVDRRLARAGKDSLAMAHARGLEASLRLDTGELELASELAKTALATHRRLSDYAGMSFALGRLARIEREAGQYRSARANLAEALRLTDILYGDGPNKAFLMGERARIAMAEGDLDAAVGDFEAMIESLNQTPGGVGQGPAGNIETYLDVPDRKRSWAPGVPKQGICGQPVAG